jgi:hypothetical protein
MTVPALPVTTAEPRFLHWLQYAGDDALKTWVRYRFAEPADHVVYLRRLASDALYCGIARADRFKARMRAHQRNAERVTVLPDTPNEFYSWFHGQGEPIDLRAVPDRVAALLLEAEATCAFAAAGYEVFGQDPGALCPARDWLGETPWWARNWRGRRLSDGTIQWLYSVREFLRVFAYAPRPVDAA